jgi:DNA-binding IclR family transcriptional regulator
MIGTNPPIQSLQRAISILRSFTEQEPELGVNELARRLELHKSTVSRMLTTLQFEGLVSQNPKTGKYRLGLGLVSLAGVALGRLDIRGAAQPYMGDLVELSQETVNVTVLDGNECVNIARTASPKPIRYVGWIGRRTPLHCTASGKVILAFMGLDQRKQLIQLPLKAYTTQTVVDPLILESSLAEICHQGYAIVHEEFEEGFSAMAAPIFDHSGSLAGTLSLSGPTFRLKEGAIERYLSPLLETTYQISRDLGFTGRGI